MKKLFLLLLGFIFLWSPQTAIAQNLNEGGVFQDDYLLGEVIEVEDAQPSEIIGDQQNYQRVQIQVNEGPEAGQLLETDYQYAGNNQALQALEPGDNVVVVRNQEFDEAFYYIADQYRLHVIIGLLLVFFAITIWFTKWKGVTSLIGLAFNIFVIIWFMIPKILAGWNPLLVSLLGGVVILGVSLYFAHGFNTRTTLSLASTFITLVIAVLLAVVFVNVTGLTGTGTEEAFFLQFGSYGNINLKGLFLGSIIIGALGVLDDVTTAQTAAIHELKKANPKLSFSQLYQSGINIGSEHITSLVNTLALAYAGSALPVLIIFAIGTQPLWVIANSEFVAEELVRTLVGSIALILAVPITTVIAAKWYDKNTPTGPSHAHHH